VSLTSVTITDVAVDPNGSPVANALITAELVEGFNNGGSQAAGGQAVGSAGVKAQHTFATTGSPTGGSFTATYSQGTITIPYNETAAGLQTLLDELLEPGIVAVSGGPLPGTGLVVTYETPGPVSVPTLNYTGLTGGTTPTATVTSTTTGVSIGAFSLTISATNDSGTVTDSGEGKPAYQFEVKNSVTDESYQKWAGPVPNSPTTTTLAALQALAYTIAD
jgi:hypothetical protein